MMLSEVQPGQEVLTLTEDGHPSYDAPIMVNHKYAPQKLTKYYQLLMESGHSLELSPGHMLFANGCCSEDQLKPARDVVLGDVLVVLDEAGNTATSPVVEINNLLKDTHVTLMMQASHRIVVNNVATTYYTAEFKDLGVTPWMIESVYGSIGMFLDAAAACTSKEIMTRNILTWQSTVEPRMEYMWAAMEFMPAAAPLLMALTVVVNFFWIVGLVLVEMPVFVVIASIGMFGLYKK